MGKTNNVFFNKFWTLFQNSGCGQPPAWKKETGSVNDSLRKTLRGCTWGHKVVPTLSLFDAINVQYVSFDQSVEHRV
jgi:hypothetical protein